MTNELSGVVLLWLATYALHSTVLLGGAWLFDYARRDLSPSVRATLWRCALLGSIVTATLHTSGIVPPLSAEIRLAVTQTGAAADAGTSMAARSVDAAASGSAARSDTRGPDVGGADATAVRARPRDAFAPGALEPAESAQPVTTTAEESTTRVYDGARTAASPERASAAPDWRLAVLAVWLAGALALGGRIVLMIRAMRRDLADRRAVHGGPLLERASAIARDAGLERRRA